MSLPRSMPVAVVLLLAAIAAGCGGNDKKDAEQSVRDFVTASNDRDANKLCNDLLSKAFIEQATGATGADAKSACKQQFKQFRGVNLHLLRIQKTTVKGDKARVETIVETEDQPQPRVFSLVKEGGRWRLAGGTGG